MCIRDRTNGELEGPAGYVRLDTEAYGGMMDYTWFDRPLSLAGRVLVREGARIKSRLVALDRDVALIPSLAIHMDGGVNKGFAPNLSLIHIYITNYVMMLTGQPLHAFDLNAFEEKSGKRSVAVRAARELSLIHI